MKIYGSNRHRNDGKGSNSDIVIHASGEGFNELDMFCDAVLEMYSTSRFVETSTCGRVIKIAKELKQMMNPMNDNPKRLFVTT